LITIGCVTGLAELPTAFSNRLNRYKITPSVAGHDGITSDGRNVQVKATFKNSLTFKTVPDYYLGFRLHPDGRYEEVFNGPGNLIYKRYASRKGIGVVLLSLPIADLKQLAEQVPENERIRRRDQ
jgi:hypothetical protein